MLTDAHCRNAICPPDRKQARLTDAGGLYLQVSPSGSKRWFYKYVPTEKKSSLLWAVNCSSRSFLARVYTA